MTDGPAQTSSKFDGNQEAQLILSHEEGDLSCTGVSKEISQKDHTIKSLTRDNLLFSQRIAEMES